MIFCSLLLGLVSPASFTTSNAVNEPNRWWFMWNQFTLPDLESIHRKLYLGEDGVAIPQTRVRYIGGQPLIAIGDKDLALRVLADPESYPNFKTESKIAKIRKISDAISTTLLPTVPQEQWERYRKVLHKSLGGVNNLESFVKVAHTLCERVIEPRVGKHVHVMDAFQRVAMDAMGKSLLGFELNTLTGESTMFDDYVRFTGKFTPLTMLYPNFMIDWVIRAIDQFKSNLIKQYDAFNLAQHNRGSRLLLPVLREAEAEGTITRLEAIDLMTFMFMSGQETTASTLAALSYYLAKHPHYQQQIRSEVLSGNSELLKNCIKETLRLSPPTFVLFSRQSTSTSELPAGRRLWILVNAIHRSANYWHEPNTFNPLRFNEPHHNQLDAWIPFGSGVRSCPGRNFALKEIEEVMKVVIMRYSIHLPANSPHQEYLRMPWSNTVKPKDLQLVFNPLMANHLVNLLAPVPRILPKPKLTIIALILLCWWFRGFLLK